jgi:hypothetical protein
MKPCAAKLGLLGITLANGYASVMADDLDAELQRNMKIYTPNTYAAAAPVARKKANAKADLGAQAEMVVFDATGRPASSQRVALGSLPEPGPASILATYII